MLIITAINKSALADISDYEVAAWINEQCIWKGFVKGHKRDDGWPALAELIAKEATK